MPQPLTQAGFPLLQAFVASQLFFSLLPLVLFASFATSITLFALVTAVIFSLFWVGVATLFLVPTLFLTCSVAVLVWLWIASAFNVARWVYNLLPAAPRDEPPPSSKRVAAWNGPKDEKVNGGPTHTENDTDYRDALVKSEAADATE